MQNHCSDHGGTYSWDGRVLLGSLMPQAATASQKQQTLWLDESRNQRALNTAAQGYCRTFSNSPLLMVESTRRKGGLPELGRTFSSRMTLNSGKNIQLWKQYQRILSISERCLKWSNFTVISVEIQWSEFWSDFYFEKTSTLHKQHITHRSLFVHDNMTLPAHFHIYKKA